MKFLEEIAAYVVELGQERMPETTVVFPNIRAGLFFRKHLSNMLENPVWCPAVMGISEFVKAHSTLHVPDRLTLIYELYRQYCDVLKSVETFDRFYFWGEIILRDFDELDRNLIDPAQLYQNLAEIKEVERQFEYLTEEQRSHIRAFWDGFGQTDSDHKQQFIDVWQGLPVIYKRFQSALIDRGAAYEGLLYRKTAEDIAANGVDRHVVFAGFNALSKSEWHIIDWYRREASARVFWDLDDYYFRDDKQEAGFFAREMHKRGGALGSTFKSTYGNRFADADHKQITVIGTPSRSGQVQVVSKLLDAIGKANPSELEAETAVVLPDEQLLLPLLHTLPGTVGHVNVTMGYPLRHSLAYGFIEQLLALQVGRKGEGLFYYKPVLAVLRHPFVKAAGGQAASEVAERVVKANMIWIPAREMAQKDTLLEHLFMDAGEGTALIDYVRELLMSMAASMEEIVQREMLAVCYKALNNLRDFLSVHQIHLAASGIIALFRQMAYNLRVPFEGEPLRGTQVMGFMETRNLDFSNVIICSMNEGAVPPARSQSSFIPISFRKAFGLPTFEHHDALYAYLFYRQIQRAEHVYLIYDSGSESGSSGEVSRYIRQLQMESSLAVSEKLYAGQVRSEEERVIVIEKNREMQARLLDYTEGAQGGARDLTPSALNTYLDCSLRFYFRYIARIREEEEVREEMDPLAFGQIFHETMERAYAAVADKGRKMITQSKIEEVTAGIDRYIDEAFADHFGHPGPNAFEYTGPNAVAREVVKKMAVKVLDEDRAFAPFELVGLESKTTHTLEVPAGRNAQNLKVRLGGTIDRIDRKEDILRVLDYKTGVDDKRIENITSLFNRDDTSRNKAAFQTFLYGYLVYREMKDFDGTLQAGLFNIRELFREGFTYLFKRRTGRGRAEEISDLIPYLEEYEANLVDLLQELFAVEGAYRQTEDRNKCVYCPYIELCGR